MDSKIIVGLVETIIINGIAIKAKIDTGASKSSIDLDLAINLGLGPIVKKSIVRSAHGKTTRPVIKTPFIIKGKTFNTYFNIIARGHMKHRVLIGNNILKKGFLIDPSIPLP